MAVGAVPSVAAAQAWHGSIAVTSDYVYRGVSQSDGDAAVQGDLHCEGEAGWFAGAWASSIDPGYDAYGNLELDLYAGWNYELAPDWTARVAYVRYLYPDAAAGIDYDYGDLSVRLAWRDRVTATVAWSPDMLRFGAHGYSERADSYAYELALRQPLFSRFAVSIGAGYYDQPAGIDYGAWNAGLSWALGRVEVDLTHFSASGDARQVLTPSAAGQRWALTGLWRF